MLSWGLAGLRHTLTTSPARHRWDHSTIDSRDDGPADEGEVVQRDGIEIETGIMLNPATGIRGNMEVSLHLINLYYIMKSDG